MSSRSKLLLLVSTCFACFVFPAASQTATRPTLWYSTFLSASSQTSIAASAIDANGYQYVTGYTTAPDFPTTASTYNRTPTKSDNSLTGYQTMFVAKFNRAGTALVYSTFVANLVPAGIAIDRSGNAYVIAIAATTTATVPTTPGSWRTSCVSASGQCAYLLKLNSSGTTLVYSTSLLGKDCGFDTTNNSEEGISFTAVAVDSTQHAYVLATAGPGCYTTPGAYKNAISSGTNLMVMRFTADASGVLYSTYVGGTHSATFPSDGGTAIAVDSLNHAVFTGTTTSTDFPTSSNAFQRTQHSQGDAGDAFIAKVNGDGSKLLASTLLGGAGDDMASGIAIDHDDQVYVGGRTDSTDFPVTAGAVDTTPDAGTCDYTDDNEPIRCSDAFVAKLPSDLSKLIYSTYLGGPNGDEASVRVAVDSVGHAYVTGYSGSSQVPLVKPTNTTGMMWLSELNSRGSAFQFSTRYGPAVSKTTNSNIEPSGIAVDPAGNAYVAGALFEGYVQTTSGAYQSAPLDSRDGRWSFAAKWDVPPCTLSTITRTVTICTPANESFVPNKMLVAAGATDSGKVAAMRVYIDGLSVFRIAASHFNTYVTLTSGTHRMTVTAWDSSGPFSKTIYVTAP
jgi:hypothetical protein